MYCYLAGFSLCSVNYSCYLEPEHLENSCFNFFIQQIFAYKVITKTSMMWPSQNFLLYKRIIIKIKANEWRNN